MHQILDPEFYHKNFEKSLGSLFKDFYNSRELEELEEEIKDKFQSLDSSIPVDSIIYRPSEEDSLLRRQHTILLIACKSMPFFASRIRKAIQLLDLNVGRSLHFHPVPGEELYYVELLGVESTMLEKVKEGIHASYFKIQDLTEQFKAFQEFIVAKNSNWSESIEDLQGWLLNKSYVWEGAIWNERGEVKSFGNTDIEPEAMDWWNSLSLGINEERMECFDSEIKSFLGDEKYFYICFIKGHLKLLFIGCLNQFAKASALVDIPFFRDRFQSFLKREQIEPFSGLGRTTRMMFNYIPTELIFLLPESSYINIHSATLEHSLRNTLRSVGVVIGEDLGLMISFVPESNWSEVAWETSDVLLQEIFPGSIIRRYFVMRGNFVEAFHLIKTKNSNLSSQKMFDASSQVEFSFRSWQEHLQLKWNESFKSPFPEGEILFHDDYKATHSPELCIHDLKMVENLGFDMLNIEISKRPDTTILHAVTPKMKFLLATWVKTLNDMGLSPISQRVYHFEYKSKTYAKSEFFFHHIENKRNLYERIKNIFHYSMLGKIRSDSLSELVLWSDLDVNGILFCKAIRDYCLQTNSIFNPEEFNRFIVDHPNLAGAAWEYFVNQFREGKTISEGRLRSEADTGKTIREDQAMHAFSSAVLSILRTDFFGTKLDNRSGIARDYLSFKIDSSIPESLPEPRPYRETFIYSSLFQGIHLRGGAVARGGIRWSDRESDYRTELLSLLKTQMVKNSIIVPVGSKGSFVLTPNKLLKLELEMVEAYKFYISGLLGLTDNRVQGEISAFDSKDGVPPYAKDETDPYLVVAADKGTAQLSDTANAISESKEFWLGDAFASGGSRGYSHKDYGITAKGALVTADRNLRLLGVDFRKERIRVVGIGDMGGDVFGNGLLESPFFQLIAAFNHKHIFLDPNPNPKDSFEERKRLFQSKQSGWDSYDSKLVSPGGGVWNRTEKSISISPQVREALGITQAHLSGSELIQAILKAPVDLLYNGGIGTYVKSSNEENSKVGDPANNDVRVNAGELRTKVVSEGGNLGFTQLGRIEFDLSGGSIFTDAIDNSAGVDLSDHEVNLKIFMKDLLEKGKITSLDERDRILKNIDNEVVESVLLDNELQSLSINADHMHSGEEGWEDYMDVSKRLIHRGILEPRISCVPEREAEWNSWKDKNPAIPRPVLATLMGHLKMDLYQICLQEEVFNNGSFPKLYLDYFPKSFIENYKDDLMAHPLNLEICTTRAVNFLVNLLGLRLELLLEGSGQEKAGLLKKILDELCLQNIPSILDKLAVIRDKKKEKDLVVFLNKLRSRLLDRWKSTQEDNLSWVDKWNGELGSEDRKSLVNLLN